MNATEPACAICRQPADPVLADLIGGIWHTCICRRCARQRLLADGGFALQWPASGDGSSDAACVASPGDGAEHTLGEIQIRPGAVDALSAAGEHYWDYLRRHASGDRGSFETGAGDPRAAFLAGPGHIVSEYRTRLGQRRWIRTAPGKLTAMLVPGEF